MATCAEVVDCADSPNNETSACGRLRSEPDMPGLRADGLGRPSWPRAVIQGADIAVRLADEASQELSRELFRDRQENPLVTCSGSRSGEVKS